MKNAVFWDIKPQFVPHRKNITSLLQCPASKCFVKFKDFTAVTMKNGVFWDVIQYRYGITSQKTPFFIALFISIPFNDVIIWNNSLYRIWKECLWDN
jgi:hypothetical protein